MVYGFGNELARKQYVAHLAVQAAADRTGPARPDGLAEKALRTLRDCLMLPQPSRKTDSNPDRSKSA
jgi:hypothetical protein